MHSEFWSHQSMVCNNDSFHWFLSSSLYDCWVIEGSYWAWGNFRHISHLFSLQGAHSSGRNKERLKHSILCELPGEWYQLPLGADVVPETHLWGLIGLGAWAWGRTWVVTWMRAPSRRLHQAQGSLLRLGWERRGKKASRTEGFWRVRVRLFSENKFVEMDEVTLYVAGFRNVTIMLWLMGGWLCMTWAPERQLGRGYWTHVWGWSVRPWLAEGGAGWGEGGDWSY